MGAEILAGLMQGLANYKQASMYKQDRREEKERTRKDEELKKIFTDAKLDELKHGRFYDAFRRNDYSSIAMLDPQEIPTPYQGVNWQQKANEARVQSNMPQIVSQLSGLMSNPAISEPDRANALSQYNQYAPQLGTVPLQQLPAIPTPEPAPDPRQARANDFANFIIKAQSQNLTDDQIRMLSMVAFPDVAESLSPDNPLFTRPPVQQDVDPKKSVDLLSSIASLYEKGLSDEDTRPYREHAWGLAGNEGPMPEGYGSIYESVMDAKRRKDLLDERSAKKSELDTTLAELRIQATKLDNQLKTKNLNTPAKGEPAKMVGPVAEAMKLNSDERAKAGSMGFNSMAMLREPNLVRVTMSRPDVWVDGKRGGELSDTGRRLVSKINDAHKPGSSAGTPQAPVKSPPTPKTPQGKTDYPRMFADLQAAIPPGHELRTQLGIILAAHKKKPFSEKELADAYRDITRLLKGN